MIRPEFEAQARAVLARMALLSYGSVQRFGGTRGGEPEHVGPTGEAMPMVDEWAAIFKRADDPSSWPDLLAEAQAELDAHVRRQFVPEATETLEELSERIVRDGWGVTAEECARAMRCTPTLVRRERMACGRHPESGYSLPERCADVHLWARQLDAAGLSVRQIEALTGVPKSTLHDRLSAA